MDKAHKSVLFSALVFPGAGHLYLKRYGRGIALVAISAATLADFIRRAWREAEVIQAQIIKEINAGGMVDLQTLVTHATAAVDRIDQQPFTVATIVLVVCWLIGIVDCYRIGRKLQSSSPVRIRRGIRA